MSKLYDGEIQRIINGKVVTVEKCKVDVTNGFPIAIKKITQADKIRSMSDEELAELLVIASSTVCDCFCDGCEHYKICFEHKLALLQSEVEK